MLAKIMDAWSRLGPQNAQKAGARGGAKAAAEPGAVGQDASEPSEASDADEENKGGAGDEADGAARAEPRQPGDIRPKEYEYLLGMPMWSVTEERVEALIREMEAKK